MYLSLQGRKALVIAGERRIGKDICLSFAREGVDPASCDISVEDGSNSRSDQRPDHAMNKARIPGYPSISFIPKTWEFTVG